MLRALQIKLRESLTVRIFLLTFVILLAASGVTFGLIAWATPMTYVSVMTNALDEQAVVLVKKMEQSTYDDMLKQAGEFAVATGAQVSIFTPDGEVLRFSMEKDYSVMGMRDATTQESTQKQENGEAVCVTTDTAVASAADTAPNAVMQDTQVDDATATAESVFYTFSVSDRQGEYIFSTVPSAQPVNQAVEALAQVAPWLLCVMLLFSVLCSLGYSRMISRPIVRLSTISRKMAALDFGWEYAEKRPDEIGALGRNLNSLSRSLATAMGELREANAALQHDIELERELEQQRLTFFSAASHELKTPITILKGQLAGMLEGVDVYQNRDKYLARALNVTGRMEHLVQELMTISRMEAADFTAKMQPLDLAVLLREQLAFSVELATQKGLTVEQRIQKTLPLEGDEKMLRKALDGILSNAVLYSPQGETVWVAAEQSAGKIQLTVENSGASIPQEALAHLFEAFYRVEQSRSRSTGGSGLGLFLTARILKRHGADYTIENTGAGVRFTACFSHR